MKKVRCVDDIKLIFFDYDGFGDKVIKEMADVKGLFLMGNATSRSGISVVEISADAHCYLDESNDFVIKNYYRLDDAYLKAPSPFNYAKEDWYKIDRVKIGHTKLTDNVVNNVHCFLSKAENPIDAESY